MVGGIQAQYLRLKSQFENSLRGMLYGIAIGDSLGLPFKNAQPGGEIVHKGKKVAFIDKFYLSDIGLRDNWSIQTALALASCRALIDIHKHDQPLKQTLDSPFLKYALTNHSPQQPAQIIVDQDGSHKLFSFSRNDSLFMRLAPVAPFSCRCGLSVQQTIDVSHQIANLTSHVFSRIFPALEFVLTLKSIFSRQELIPDVTVAMQEWASGNGHDREFERYLETRQSSLEKIPLGFDTWIWRRVSDATLGFLPGQRWSDIQSFGSCVLKVVNDSYNRDVAGAVAGAIVGAGLGKDTIPWKFASGIRGEVHLDDAVKHFSEEFFKYKSPKQYNLPKIASIRSDPEQDIKRHPEPTLVYDSSPRMGCAHFTVVVKNTSLNANYEDGVGAFARKFHGRCNDRITVICDMGSDVNSIISALVDCGLTGKTDFCVLDLWSEGMIIGMDAKHLGKDLTKTIDTGVEWVKADHEPNVGFQVWFNEEPKSEQLPSVPDQTPDVDELECEGEGNILVYGELTEGELVFLDRSEAQSRAKMNRAIAECLNTGITWGQFRDKYPEVYEELSKNFAWDFMNFENWYDTEPNNKYTSEEAKLKYKAKYQMENAMPLMEFKFEFRGNFYESMMMLCRFAPQQRAEDLLPKEIAEKYGSVEQSFHDGDFLRFDAKDEADIVAALKEHGFCCVRNNQLIFDACSGSV